MLSDTLKSYTLVNSLTRHLNNWTLEIEKYSVLGTQILKGKIKNNNDSRVLLVKHSDHYSGIIQTSETQFRLDPTDLLNGSVRQMVLYKTKDMVSTHKCTRCSSRNRMHQLRTSTIRRLSKRAANSKSCSMVLLADATFSKTFGKDSKSKMTEAIEIASEIYQTNFNVKLVAKNIQILTDKSLAINSAKSISEVLTALSTEQAGEAYGPKANAEKYCLSHLFTSRNFGSTTGLAYEAKKDANVIGGVCDGTTSGGKRSLNVGLSTSNLGTGNMNINAWHTTVIHEISHGFGSAHDDDTSCRNVRGKIMQAIVNAESPSIPSFSKCSLNDIRSKIASVKCLSEDSSSLASSSTARANATESGLGGGSANAISKMSKILDILAAKPSDSVDSEETTDSETDKKPKADPGLAPSQPPSADKKSTSPPPISNTTPPAIPNATPPQIVQPLAPPAQPQPQGGWGLSPKLGGLIPRIQSGSPMAPVPLAQGAIQPSSPQANPSDPNVQSPQSAQPQASPLFVQPVLPSVQSVSQVQKPAIQPALPPAQSPQIAQLPAIPPTDSQIRMQPSVNQAQQQTAPIPQAAQAESPQPSHEVNQWFPFYNLGLFPFLNK